MDINYYTFLNSIVPIELKEIERRASIALKYDIDFVYEFHTFGNPKHLHYFDGDSNPNYRDIPEYRNIVDENVKAEVSGLPYDYAAFEKIKSQLLEAELQTENYY